LFLPLVDLAKVVPIGIFAAISVLSAGFYAWKEAVEKLPKAADLTIS
jgi:hypothetical protein